MIRVARYESRLEVETHRSMIRSRVAELAEEPVVVGSAEHLEVIVLAFEWEFRGQELEEITQGAGGRR